MTREIHSRPVMFRADVMLCVPASRRLPWRAPATRHSHPCAPPAGPLTRLPVGEEHHRLDDHKLGQRADGPQLVVCGLQGGAGQGQSAVTHLPVADRWARQAGGLMLPCAPRPARAAWHALHPSSTRLVQQHEAVQRPRLGKVVDQGNIGVRPASGSGRGRKWLVSTGKELTRRKFQMCTATWPAAHTSAFSTAPTLHSL